MNFYLNRVFNFLKSNDMHLGLLSTNRRKAMKCKAFVGIKKRYIFITTPNLINVFSMPGGQLILNVNTKRII